MKFLSSRMFWLPALCTFITCGLFFAWELGMFMGFVWSLPRPAPSQTELLSTAIIALLLSFDVGLIVWRTKYGSCPVGMKRATSAAGFLGAVALLCPVCLALPLSLAGLGTAIALLGPFVPLVRTISLVLLAAAAWMLWPKKGKKRKM